MEVWGTISVVLVNKFIVVLVFKPLRQVVHLWKHTSPDGSDPNKLETCALCGT